VVLVATISVAWMMLLELDANRQPKVCTWQMVLIKSASAVFCLLNILDVGRSSTGWR